VERLPYNPGLVEAASREFADILRARYPEWCSLLTMIRLKPDEPWRMDLVVPSPTGDEDRALQFWMNNYYTTSMNYDEPSIGFGHWHTHLGCCDSMEELPDLADAIRTDMKVEYFDCAWDSSHWWVLDDWNDEFFSELLNDPSWSGRIRVRSWGGTRDGEYRLDSLAKRPDCNNKEQD
jgi:hypothetical protein